MEETDGRRFAPATARNRDPILDVLKTTLPSKGTVLEISSGTGEHAVFFAKHFSGGRWIPSDPHPKARQSISAWIRFEKSANVSEPLDLDVTQEPWPCPEPLDAVVNINMVHIAPWSACVALMEGAAKRLTKGGLLFLYGPYKRDGVHTAPSNAEFDAKLRAENPEWGVRNLEDVVALAGTNGFGKPKIVSMPANNLSVIFSRE